MKSLNRYQQISNCRKTVGKHEELEIM